MKLWRVLSAFAAFAAAAVSSYAAGPADWLLDPSPYVASVDFNETSRELTLTNGLVSRRVLLAPNAATVSLRNLATGEEFVRALAPEARVTLDGKEYPVGGLTGAPVANYWREEWAADAQAIPDAYRYERYEVGEIEERFPYKKRPEWLSRDLAWPPTYAGRHERRGLPRHSEGEELCRRDAASGARHARRRGNDARHVR